MSDENKIQTNGGEKVSQGVSSEDIDKMLSELYESEGGDELAKIAAVQMEQIVNAAPAETERKSKPKDETRTASKDFLNSHISVRISKDGLAAEVHLSPYQEDDPVITAEDIVERLKDMGVVYGIDYDVLKKVARLPYPSSPVVVTKGKAPIPGENADLDYIFLDKQKIGPKQRKDGSVDFRDIGLVTNVKAGDILVEKTPATSGTPGISVKGQQINAKPGRDKKFKKGRGVKESEDGFKLIAAVDGSPHVADGRVTVEALYVVTGNVDYAIGNIDFVGNVKILGNIESGFTVKAFGDIEVIGLVENATVKAGGSITIKGRAFGRSKGLISADQNIIAKLIDQYKVKAGGNLIVDEGVMHSDVTAEKSVMVRATRGRIVGGTVRAGELVDAAIIGDPNYGTRTNIEVGMSPEMRRELHQVKERIIENKANLQKVSTALQSLRLMKKKLNKLPTDKEKIIVDLETVKSELEQQIESLEGRETQLENTLNVARPAYVKAHRVICPGVRVTINDRVRLISSEIEYCTLGEEEGDIKIGPYA